MKAVMARILGRAGSGGALRWARAGEVRIKTEQSKTQKRSVPRRIGYLQTGRSNAAPPTRYKISFGCELDLKGELLAQHAARLQRNNYTKAEMPVMRSPMTSLWMSFV